jgi:hypothetical protein
MGRTRDVSKILTSNTSILTLASASSVYQTIAKTGLIELTPSTISVTGGSGSVSATGAVSFSSASAISLNDVFSATYDRYKIIVNQTGASVTGGNMQMRLRVSGSDNSATNYRSQLLEASSTSIGGVRTTGATNWVIGRNQSGHRSWVETDVINPFDSNLRPTFWSNYNDVITGNITFSTVSGALDVTTSYTGFTVLAESGNMTGTISVYGYNK